MTSTRALLENRLILVVILLSCAYEGIALWLTLTKYHRFPHDPLSIFGLAFAIFITASVTLRSRFFADRVVFGVITITFLLTAMRTAPLTPLAMLAAKLGEAFMWTIAALVSLIVFVRSLGTSRGENIS